MSSEADVFAAAIERLRGEMRESLADLRGSINTLAATKDGETARIELKLRDLRGDVEAVTGATKALHQRVDQYPAPDKVTATVDRMHRMLWIGLGIAVGAGGAGGGLGYALSQILAP